MTIRPARTGDRKALAEIVLAAIRASFPALLPADAIGSGPLATVALPNRVPFGFHCSWVPAGA